MSRIDERPCSTAWPYSRDGMESPMVDQRYDAEGGDGREKRDMASAEENRLHQNPVNKKGLPSF